MTALIQNEQNTAISKHFTKPAEYIRKTSGTIFSADVQISGGQMIFQYKPGCILKMEGGKVHLKNLASYGLKTVLLFSSPG